MYRWLAFLALVLIVGIADSQKFMGKKSGTGKKGTKHSASPSAFWMCNAQSGNYEYRDTWKQQQEPSVSDWVYPFPRLLSGFVAFAGKPPHASLTIPITTADAAASGWSTMNDALCKWVHPDSNRHRLSFMNGWLVSVEVLVEPSPALQDHFYTDNGYEIFFQNGLGTIGIYDHNGIEYPLLESIATARDGWKQGSCVPAMGGFHYYQDWWDELKPVTPIYHMGMMQALLITTGLVEEGSTIGFDEQGIAFSTDFLCDVNFCNLDECAQSLALTATSKSGKKKAKHTSSSLSSFTACGCDNKSRCASSTVHLFWNLDPSDMSDWKPCDFPCLAGPCSCCGTSEEETQPRDCAAPWPPLDVN